MKDEVNILFNYSFDEKYGNNYFIKWFSDKLI